MTCTRLVFIAANSYRRAEHVAKELGFRRNEFKLLNAMNVRGYDHVFIIWDDTFDSMPSGPRGEIIQALRSRGHWNAKPSNWYAIRPDRRDDSEMQILQGYNNYLYKDPYEDERRRPFTPCVVCREVAAGFAEQWKMEWQNKWNTR